MRRIIIQGLLACLLALFPGLIPAQSLTFYEYWFDDDISGRQTGALNGTEVLFESTIDTEHLPDGVHFLNFRAKQSDGQYSSVTSSCFYKMKIEEGSILEYWIDNDRSNVRTIQGTLASDGHDYIFNAYLDMRAVSPGLHRLNLRPRSASGLTAGAITTADFIKISNVTANKLEYWLDGDRSTVHVIEGALASDGEDYIFNANLDLGDVTPGYHRLYYRAVSSTDLTASAVSMSPIIVKSRYYHDENEEVVMKKYSISVDDETPMIHDVLRPKEDFPYNGSLDARYLSQGQHTLKAQFWNSMGMSVSVEQPFTVKLFEPGEITLTATEQDGLVKLEYNNVPNNVKHGVLRAVSGGRWWPVHTVKESCSPDVTSHFIDIPSAAGTYKYKVKSCYENYDGSIDTVVSNVVTVNVANTQDELTNYGYIIGQVPDMYPLIKHAYFSDGEHVPFTGCHFSREMIEVGKELTIEVIESSNSETYYEPVTLTVKAGENLVNFEPLTGADRPYYDEHHLEFASDLDWTGTNFTFDVKCHASKRWKGRVRLRVIKKNEYQENSGDDGSGGINPDGDAGTEAGAVAPMPNVEMQKNYYYTYSEPFTLDPGKTTTVTLSLENLFPDDKKEHYLCFFESEGQWRDGVESMDEIRLLVTNRAYNVTENPEDRLIDKSLLEQSEDEVARQDAEYAANLILMVSGYIKSLDGILLDSKLFCDFMKEWLKDTHSGIVWTQYESMMGTALTSEAWDELLKSELVQKAPAEVLAKMAQKGSDFTQNVRENIVNDILKYGKDINKYLGKAMKLLKEAKELDSESEYDRTFHCAQLILNFAEHDNPFVSIVKTYVDVAQIVISKALEWGAEYYGGFQAGNLYDNIPSGNDSQEYNKNVNFKIKVQTNRLVYFNFSPNPFVGGNGTSAIREVKVMLSNRNINEVDTIYFEPVGVWNGVMLKQTRYVGEDPWTDRTKNIDGGDPLKRIWMEIKWKNGRTSKVPLVTDGSIDGVEYDQHSSPFPCEYTITFKSKTWSYDNIADIIELKH